MIWWKRATADQADRGLRLKRQAKSRLSMTLFRIAGTATAFCTLISAAYAGPWSDDIARVERQVNERLEAIAAAGPTGVQDATARGKHLQPTPRSIATAEKKLGELSQQKINAVRHAMDVARAADASGDKSACEKALADVKRELAR
jgi:hypothetical protein